MIKITDFGFNAEEEEIAETVRQKYEKTNWPKPLSFAGNQSAYWRLVYEVYNQSIEELYFWIIDAMQRVVALPEIEKITDVFAASEQSAFFGVAQQRLGLQQDKVSQFLATIGKMIKELFQLVRELRILDERLEYYHTSFKGDQASEITLKGYWIDLVEGGAKTPSSVYGMARELQFVTLPDIFFGSPPMKSEEVQKYVESLSFNNKVKEVLMRKLKSFIVWKEHTFRELKSRRTFTIKYLRQHYEIIRMYMAWVKPYLRNIRKMNLDSKKMDSADMVSAFEGSMMEIEVMGKRDFGKGVYAILDAHFIYRSRPELKFQQEGYQRGPIHVGKTQVTIRAYAWTEEELANYKRFRAKEDFDLLGTIDSSVKAAYEALGDELDKYLKEAEGMEKQKEEPEHHSSFFSPLTSIFKGFADAGKAFAPHKSDKPKKMTKQESKKLEDTKTAASEHLETWMYQFVKRFKANFGFIY